MTECNTTEKYQTERNPCDCASARFRCPKTANTDLRRSSVFKIRALLRANSDVLSFDFSFQIRKFLHNPGNFSLFFIFSPLWESKIFYILRFSNRGNDEAKLLNSLVCSAIYCFLQKLITYMNCWNGKFSNIFLIRMV